MKKTYKISGMDCASCAKLLELDLEDVGIKGSCSFANSTLSVESDMGEEKLFKIVQSSGYSIAPSKN